MDATEVSLATIPAMRVAVARGVAPGYGPSNIGPLFDRLLPIVWRCLVDAGIEPGTCVAVYDWPATDGSVTAEIGFVLATHESIEDERVRVVELASTTAVAVEHRGPIDTISDTFATALQWIDQRGHRIAGRSRQIYRTWDPASPAVNVIEIQVPVEPKPVGSAPG